MCTLFRCFAIVETNNPRSWQCTGIFADVKTWDEKQNVAVRAPVVCPNSLSLCFKVFCFLLKYFSLKCQKETSRNKHLVIPETFSKESSFVGGNWVAHLRGGGEVHFGPCLAYVRAGRRSNLSEAVFRLNHGLLHAIAFDFLQTATHIT